MNVPRAFHGSAFDVRRLADDGGTALFGSGAPLGVTGDGTMERVRQALSESARPMAVAGGPGWSDADADTLRDFAEAYALPVCCPGRYRDIIDHESPCFAGCLGINSDPALADRLAAADLMLVIGSGADAGVDSKAERIVLDGPPLLTPAVQPDIAPERLAWMGAAHADAMAWVAPPPPDGSMLDMGSVVDWLRDRLPADAVVAVEGDGVSSRVPRYLLFRRPGRLIPAPEPKPGFAVAASVAARMLLPKRVVVGVTDADGLQVAGPALAEAVQAGVAPLIIAITDARAGNVIETAEENGAFTVRIERTRDFAPAFWDAMWSGRAAVIELRCDRLVQK